MSNTNILLFLQVVIIGFVGSLLVIDSLNLFARDPTGDQEVGRGPSVRVQRYTGRIANFSRIYVLALKVTIVPAYVMVAFLIALQAFAKVPLLSWDLLTLIFVIVALFTILGVSCLVILVEVFLKH